MRRKHGTRPVTRAMDVMPPWRAFGTLPSSATHDARRFLRPVLFTLLGATTVALLLGTAAAAPHADTLRALAATLGF